MTEIVPAYMDVERSAPR